MVFWVCPVPRDTRMHLRSQISQPWPVAPDSLRLPRMDKDKFAAVSKEANQSRQS
jgi:hypothetical protein